MMSNLFFAMITIFAPWTRSLHAATALVALCGIPWAISCWAPFGLLGVEINKMSSSGPHASVNGSVVPGYTAVRASVEEDSEHRTELEMEETGAGARGNSQPQHQQHRRIVSDGVLRINHPDDDSDAYSSTGELAGIYLGVLNVYTTLPQFVGTFVSWVVFSILEPSRVDPTPGGEGADTDDPDHHRWLNLTKDAPNAIAVCMFVGALCSVVGAEAARRLRKLES